MSVAAIIGDPDAVAAFLASPAGAGVARELAAAVFADDDRLAAYELGEDVGLPAAVEAELDRLIEQRNRRERRR